MQMIGRADVHDIRSLLAQQLCDVVIGRRRAERLGCAQRPATDADELAATLTARMGELNQDLALLAPVFDALEPGQRAELLQQLRYAAELVAYLEES